MPRLIPAAALICALLPAAPVAAQEVDCTAPTMQMEMTYCAEQDWLTADAALNDAYKAAMAAQRRIDADLPADQRGAEDYLRQAQRAWVSFRDAACAAEGYQAHGGSMEPMLIYACRARLTAARSADLRAMVLAP